MNNSTQNHLTNSEVSGNTITFNEGNISSKSLNNFLNRDLLTIEYIESIIKSNKFNYKKSLNTISDEVNILCHYFQNGLTDFNLWDVTIFDEYCFIFPGEYTQFHDDEPGQLLFEKITVDNLISSLFRIGKIFLKECNIYGSIINTKSDILHRIVDCIINQSHEIKILPFYIHTNDIEDKYYPVIITFTIGDNL